MNSVEKLAEIAGYGYERKEREEREEREKQEKLDAYALVSQTAYDLGKEYGLDPFDIAWHLTKVGRRAVAYDPGEGCRKVIIVRDEESKDENGLTNWRLSYYLEGGSHYYGQKVDDFSIGVYLSTKDKNAR